MKHQKSAPDLKALSDAAWRALEGYQQADEEGVMVLVSRQAIHEVIADHAALCDKADRLAEALKRVLDASLAFADDDRFSPEEIRYAHESNRNIARAALSEWRGEE